MPDGLRPRASSRACTSCGRRRRKPQGAAKVAPVRQRADPAARAAGAGAAGGAFRRGGRRVERDQLQGAAPRRAGGGALEPAAPDGEAAAELPGDSAGARRKASSWRPATYMRAVPEMIGRWVPGGLFALGTDGFGRSETRRGPAALRGRRRVHHRGRAVAAGPARRRSSRPWCSRRSRSSASTRRKSAPCGREVEQDSPQSHGEHRDEANVLVNSLCSRSSVVNSR